MRKLVLILLFVGITVIAQDAKYPLSETQSLRLQVKQKDAQIAQQNVFLAQQVFAGAMKALNEEAEKVKADNKWSADVQFVPEQLKFVDAPKQPEKLGIMKETK